MTLAKPGITVAIAPGITLAICPPNRTLTLAIHSLTGVPVEHVENASATGSSAFREAVLAVAVRACDTAMALGFDGQLRSMGGGPALNRPAGMETSLLWAAFFAFWAVRRMHDNGTTVETFAKIAAKNWNHARFNKYAERQAQAEVTVEQVLTSPMVADPHTAMMACGAGQERQRPSWQHERSLLSSRTAGPWCVDGLPNAIRGLSTWPHLPRCCGWAFRVDPYHGEPCLRRSGPRPEDLDLVQA